MVFTVAGSVPESTPVGTSGNGRLDSRVAILANGHEHSLTACEAATVGAVIAENLTASVSERGVGRGDDRTSKAAMEDRKREGYF